MKPVSWPPWYEYTVVLIRYLHNSALFILSDFAKRGVFYSRFVIFLMLFSPRVHIQV